MGETAFYVLAIALAGIFGSVGVLLGLWVGVRNVTRDEMRYAAVAEEVEAIRSDQSRLRLDWAGTLESLDQLAGAVEKGRRRIAASESAAKRKGDDEEVPRELTVSEQRDEIRRRMRRVV